MGVLVRLLPLTLCFSPRSTLDSAKMTFWQENYAFIKDVYDMRHQKMAEWMENVEKAIARIMADKVYTSAEFKRERDNFHALCKDLERSEVKKWLAQILEILMAERAKDQKLKEGALLDALIKKHEELIPTVLKTQVKVDLYWKCYAYGDELKPHIEFLDGIMLSSTRDIAPSCVENVDELIERQEKSLVQLDTKRNVVKDLIEKGKKILENPDKPKFLEGHVQRIEVGWDDTKSKAQDRLKLLTETKDAWVGYAENNETIAGSFEKAEEEIKKVKKHFNLDAAKEDLAKRQDIFNKSKDNINGLFSDINDNFKCMCITIPDDKKKILDKEIKAVGEKLEVVGRFEEVVKVVEDFVHKLDTFNTSLNTLDGWMKSATDEMEAIRAAAGSMLPKDAQNFKDELARITKYITDLAEKVRKDCDAFSEDVKFWAEYRTGIKEFTPWLVGAEKATTEGLSKPSDLNEVKALHEKVHTFEKTCLKYLQVLTAASDAAQKMTTHDEADGEVAALRERYAKVKAVADGWTAKVDTLLKEWTLLDNTVTELNTWVAKDKSSEGENQFSLEKMVSTLGELKNIFKQKEKLVDGL